MMWSLDERLAMLDQLGVDVVRYTLRWDHIALSRPQKPGEPGRPRLRLEPERRSPRRSASPWNRRRPDRLGHARLGERPAETELGPEEPLGAGPVRDRGREALPVGAQVGDLERAESARRALPELATAVRPAAAEPGRRRPARGRPAQRRRRRRDLAARHAHRALRGRVREQDAPRRREVRRLLASSIPALVRPRPARDAAADSPCTRWLTMASLQCLLRDVTKNFGPKHIWLTEYAYKTNPSRPLPRRCARSAGALSRRGGAARLSGPHGSTC